MNNGTDPAVIQMEADFPRWQVWVNTRTLPALGGGMETVTTWCARRWDGTGSLLAAYSEYELAGYITEAELEART